jgi:Fe-S-cluster-containing dehydrogenase component
MSNGIKETMQGFLNKDMTRRQFMKISGKSLAGLTLSVSMLNLLGVTQKEVNAAQVAVWATPQGLLVVNADICVGCLLCEANCTLVNDGATSAHSSRIKVTRNLMANANGVGMYKDLDRGWDYFPDTCRQCVDAPCATACPTNAITPDSRGIQVVNEDLCIGCTICNMMCPWEMIPVNPDTNKAVKCTLCNVCVERCPSGALRVVPWDAVTAAAQENWAG